MSALLRIEYHRINDRDRSGMINIDAEGAENWHFADIGSHCGMQGEKDGHDPRVMKFGAAVAKLVREHFGDVRPLISERKL